MSLMNMREYHFGEFQLKLRSRSLERDGVPVPLGSKAFELLAYLAMHPGEVVTKEELLKAAWPDSYVEEKNLAQQIVSLRKALADKSDCIATIPGRGYQFTALVREVPMREVPIPDPAPEDASPDVVHAVRKRTHVVIEESIQPTFSAKPSAKPPRSWTRLAWYGTVGVALGLGAWFGWQWHQRAATAEFHTVIVADFSNKTGDAAFDGTLRRALEIELGQSPSLDVMSEDEVVKVLRLMGQKSESVLTGDVAREVCVRGNRQILVSGEIASVGRTYLLTVEATDCQSGQKLAGAKAQAETKEGVLGKLDLIADRVRSKLGESAKSLASFQVPIEQATTPSLEALKAYSIGQSMGAQARVGTDALPFYQRAVQLDPQFAMAYEALASAYYNMDEYSLASQNFQKAFDLSDRVSAHERLMLRAHYYAEGPNDLQMGIQAYRIWASTYPHDSEAAVGLINLYTQIGEYPQAVAFGEQALKSQPEDAGIYLTLVGACKRAGQFAEAKSLGARAIQRGKDASGMHASLWQVAYAEHDQATLTRETQWAHSHGDGWYDWFLLDQQASAAASEGHLSGAEELYRQTIATAKREGLAELAEDLLIEQAEVELQLGRPDLARATASHVVKPDSGALELATLRAALGDVKFAERVLAVQESKARPGSIDTTVYLPRLRAKLAMQRGKPLDAISALEPAAQYELRELDVPNLRAEAYLKAGQPGLAILEYKKISMNPGIDPVSPLLTLAHLGLARAYAAAANEPASRAEYTSFLAAWRTADPDLPPLNAAQAEVARIGHSPN